MSISGCNRHDIGNGSQFHLNSRRKYKRGWKKLLGNHRWCGLYHCRHWQCFGHRQCLQGKSSAEYHQLLHRFFGGSGSPGRWICHAFFRLRFGKN